MDFVMIARFSSLACCAALLTLAACENGTGTGSAGPAASLQVVSGNLQDGAAGRELPQALVARVVDSGGRPVRGQFVSFRVVAGGGSVFAGGSNSNDSGVVQERWTLGKVAGDSQALEARAVDNNTGAPLVFGTFRANAITGPAQIVSVSPETPTLTGLGSTVQFQAVAVDTFGNTITGRPFTWTSSSPQVATVSGAGVGTAVADGAATISATIDSRSGSAVLTVNQQVSTIQLTPTADTLFGGDTVRLVAMPRDANAQPMAKPVTWTSADTAGAKVDASGLVTAGEGRLGPVAITATAGGKSANATITIVVDSLLVRTAVGYASGASSSCGLASGGRPYCWGSFPRLVPGGLRFKMLSGGWDYSCGVSVADAAYCMGTSLGVTTSAFTLVPGGYTFSEVRAGGGFACGITIAGPTYCWGSANTPGGGSATPMQVAGTYVSLTAGYYFVCGVSPNGAAYCWGDGGHGQLGGGAYTPFSSSPVLVSGGLTLVSLSAGNDFTCGVTQGTAGSPQHGPAYCWGNGVKGQLGNGTIQGTNVPTLVSGGYEFTMVATGSMHTCGLLGPGIGNGVLCWGRNDYGELGNSSGGAVTPIPVSGGTSFVFITAKEHHTCGLATDAVSFCWGRAGAVGDGTNTNRFAPTRILGQSIP